MKVPDKRLIPDEETLRQHMAIANELARHLSLCTVDWMKTNGPDLSAPHGAAICNAALLGLMAYWAAEHIPIDVVDEYVLHQAAALKDHVIRHIEKLASGIKWNGMTA